MAIKKGLTILLTTIGILSTPINIQEKNIQKNYLKKETQITAFDFERMQGLVSWYGQEINGDILKNFIKQNNLFEGLEESVQTEKDSLIRLVQKYSNPKKRFKNKDYQNNIFPEFIKLNKEITQKKETHNKFSILEFSEQNILINKSRGKRIYDLEYKIISEYKQKVDVLKKLEVNEEYSVVARTILNSIKVLPLIKYLNNQKIDENSILSIMAKESVGTPYIVGPEKEINAFQINPEIIPKLYLKLKMSKKEEDKPYQLILNVKNNNLKEFTNNLKRNFYQTTTFGLYYMKEIKKESFNESHFVLLYHLGENKFSNLPYKIRKRIFSKSINNTEDINNKDLRYIGMPYLKQYYSLKNRFKKIDEILKKEIVNK